MRTLWDEVNDTHYALIYTNWMGCEEYNRTEEAATEIHVPQSTASTKSTGIDFE